MLSACVMCACAEEGGGASRDHSTAPRVVSLMPATTAILLALGAEGRLVARTHADPKDARIARLPSVGDPLAPSLEELARARPDLVVVWSGSPRAGDVGRALAPSGRVMTLDIQSVGDLRRAIDTLGAATDRRHAADSLIADLDADLASAARVAGVDSGTGGAGGAGIAVGAGGAAGAGADPVESPPIGGSGTGAGRRAGPPLQVAWLVWPDPPRLAGYGSFVHEVLTRAGGQNVMRPGEGAWPAVSMEVLIDRDPDVVVWPTGGGVPGPESAARLWNAVPAVRRGSVLRVDADSLHVPGPWIGRATLDLARRLAGMRDGSLPGGPPDPDSRRRPR